MIFAQNISRHFEGIAALSDVSLQVDHKELVAILGTSGSGKTTLLRIIAGLEQADQGQVFLNDIDATRLHPHQRQIGFVFQHYALFRHMTIKDNIAFGLRVKRKWYQRASASINKRVEHLLEMMQLSGMGHRYPAQLSGGQRQRVALARALATEPNFLLLDEPFGALDAQVRKDLRRWLRKIHDELGLSCIFVTHDQEEAMEIADRVVIMNQGKIEQIATPLNLYDHPASSFVARFLGQSHEFIGRIHHHQLECEGGLNLKINHGFRHDTDYGSLFVRYHDIHLSKSESSQSEPAQSHGVIDHITVQGAQVHIEVILNNGQRCDVQISRDLLSQQAFKIGTKVMLSLNHVKYFAA